LNYTPFFVNFDGAPLQCESCDAIIAFSSG